MTKTVLRILVACVAASLVGQASAAEPDEQKQAASADGHAVTDADKAQQDAPIGKGIAAMEAAAKADKYLFALLRKEDDEPTEEMRTVVAATLEQVADRAQSVEVDVSAESERAFVDRFGLRWAPTPLLLAIAPNGVVIAGFPVRVEAEDLLDAFVSPATERLLKALGERKLVFLCVQNSKSERRKAAMRGVRKFRRDERFAEGTEIIVVNPADKGEADLLENLQIDPQTLQAITVFFGPRGRRIGEYHGETNFDELVQTLTMSMSGFG